MTVEQFSDTHKVKSKTVLKWIESGFIPGAYLKEALP